MGNQIVTTAPRHVLLAAMAMATVSFAMKRMGGDLSKFLKPLVEDGLLTEDQSYHIANHCMEQEFLYADRHGPGAIDQSSVCAVDMKNYLEGEVVHGPMSQETAYYVANLFGLDLSNKKTARAYGSSFGLAPNPAMRNYNGEGIVQYEGLATFSPPDFNGIWGYAVGDREYALQCHGLGLDIVDIARADATVRVQFIPMPGGTTWRDVETYKASDGKTYAYVAAQGDAPNANLWVVDLSYLSGTSAHGADSNPIPSTAIWDRGESDMGHTMQVNQQTGLLVLNSANPSDGCRLFDISSDPTNPTYLASHNGSENDCHDSQIIADFDIPGKGPRDVLLSADGRSGRYRIVDITDIRNGGSMTVLGETETMGFMTYAHSVSYLTRESRKYLVVFEESNSFDMAIHDITDPSSIVLLGSFQHAAEESNSYYTEDHYVHNGHVRGNFLYVAYYEAGFRVYDLTDLSAPAEVGMYQTYVEDPNDFFSWDSFNGAWNLYVGLPSRRILVSDRGSGTYVFSINEIGQPPSVDPSPSNPPAGGPTPSSPTPSPVPSPSPPTGGEQCTDVPGWYFIDPLFGCEWYANSGCYSFAEYMGHTAMTACCDCGGGIYNDTPSAPTPTPVSTPTDSVPSPTPAGGGFSIRVMNMGYETKYDALFLNAAARWVSLLHPTDFPDVPSGVTNDLFNGTFSRAVDVPVDDILMGYAVAPFDSYGMLGLAGPTAVVVDDKNVPVRVVAGVIFLDSNSVRYYSNEDIELIILHEMGHVLGFNLFWPYRCGTGCLNGDTSYQCPEANAKYQELNPGGELLLEPNVCGHFDEQSFSSYSSSELMTPTFESYQDQPISTVTLAVLKECAGYDVVYEMADDYDPYPYSRNLRSIMNRKKARAKASLQPTSNFSLEGKFIKPSYTSFRY